MCKMSLYDCVSFFRERLQALKPYSMRGIDVNGNFSNIFIGKVLLMARFAMENYEIQFLWSRFISTEYEDIWTLFL